MLTKRGVKFQKLTLKYNFLFLHITRQAEETLCQDTLFPTFEILHVERRAQRALGPFTYKRKEKEIIIHFP